MCWPLAESWSRVMESPIGGRFYVTRGPLLASEYVTAQVLVSMGSQTSESAAVPALLRNPEVAAGEMSAGKAWRPFTAREWKV
jgi:hypothetical protein